MIEFKSALWMIIEEALHLENRTVVRFPNKLIPLLLPLVGVFYYFHVIVKFFIIKNIKFVTSVQNKLLTYKQE